ncbi:MAG: hypothetical protein QM844_18200 [Planctomycetota bacterium]|nr:hypothetical protein [Planctomycetota bacterium]
MRISSDWRPRPRPPPRFAFAEPPPPRRMFRELALVAEPAVTEPTNARVSVESVPTNAPDWRLVRTNRSDESTVPADPTPKLPELPVPPVRLAPPIDVRVPAVTPLPNDRLPVDPAVADREVDDRPVDDRPVCWARASPQISPTTNNATLNIIQRLAIGLVSFSECGERSISKVEGSSSKTPRLKSRAHA